MLDALATFHGTWFPKFRLCVGSFVLLTLFCGRRRRRGGGLGGSASAVQRLCLDGRHFRSRLDVGLDLDLTSVLNSIGRPFQTGFGIQFELKIGRQFHFDFVIFLFQVCFTFVSIWLQLFVHLLVFVARHTLHEADGLI